MDETPVVQKRELISVSDLLDQSWRLFVTKLFSLVELALLQLGLVVLIVALAIGGVFVFLFFKTELIYFECYAIVALCLILLIYYFMLRAQISLMLAAASIERKSFREYFSLSKGKPGGFFWLLIFQGLAIAGGYVLLLIPGIIIAITSSFCIWIYVLEGPRGLEAIQRSRLYAHNRIWGIIGRTLLLGLIVGAIGEGLQLVTAKSVIASGILGVFYNFLAGAFSICYSYLLYKSASETYDQSFMPKLWYLKLLIAISSLLILCLVAALGYFLFSRYLPPGFLQSFFGFK